MRWWALILMVLLGGCQPSTEKPVQKAEPKGPKLKIKVGAQERVWTRDQLLGHPRLELLTLVDHSAYEERTMSYKAVPLGLLFEGIELAADQTLEYRSTDGFSSSISPDRLLNLNPESSVAYLAVEDPAQPWPNFENRDYGPGPFYVVWKNPEISDIGREEWPFKLTGFYGRPHLEKRYPEIPPHPEQPRDGEVWRGYHVFVKNCLPCHMLNQQGTATFGPDLNVPRSPTEYLAPGALKKLIRDPQSLRTWKNGKMPGFPEKEISDQELEWLERFLEHKAATRSKRPPS